MGLRIAFVARGQLPVHIMPRYFWHIHVFHVLFNVAGPDEDMCRHIHSRSRTSDAFYGSVTAFFVTHQDDWHANLAKLELGTLSNALIFLASRSPEIVKQVHTVLPSIAIRQVAHAV